MTVIIPRVHLNGTAKQDLLDQLKELDRALRNAEDALAKASPNARDYYVIDADAFTKARDQHVRRARLIAGIRDEIMGIAVGIVDQGK